MDYKVDFVIAETKNFQKIKVKLSKKVLVIIIEDNTPKGTIFTVKIPKMIN